MFSDPGLMRFLVAVYVGIPVVVSLGLGALLGMVLL
jgi:hypothetical protein